jgi:N-acetylmuramoyl-L-alanine amidase CwlA
MKIIKRLNNNPNHFNGINKCLYITVHETSNTNKGANALNHAKYLEQSQATWHYTVDDVNIVQSFEDNIQCWHCGDGTGQGNRNSIGIEMCVNSDGNIYKTIDNTVELIRFLMIKHNIPIENVVQHNHWSGKDCPKNIRRNYPISWKEFINKIKTTKNYYSVQIGCFENKNNAENLKKELIEKGYTPIITIKKI